MYLSNFQDVYFDVVDRINEKNSEAFYGSSHWVPRLYSRLTILETELPYDDEKHNATHIRIEPNHQFQLIRIILKHTPEQKK